MLLRQVVAYVGSDRYKIIATLWYQQRPKTSDCMLEVEQVSLCYACKVILCSSHMNSNLYYELQVLLLFETSSLKVFGL